MKGTRFALMCLGILLAAGFAQSRTIFVDDDNTTGPRDGLEEHPYQRIWNGIDAASNGDTVLVADGTYNEWNLGFEGKAITLRSENGPENCIIDEGFDTHVFYFHSGETPASVVDGFTIMGGWAVYGYTEDRGGGIFCSSSSPTIKNNIIRSNEAMDCGGGIYCYNSSPIIANNVIESNLARTGAGICCYDSSPTITGNIIRSNQAMDCGGGIYCYNSSPIIANNIIASNSARTGAGICCYDSSPTITGNIIKQNSLIRGLRGGGGIACFGGSAMISNNLIMENSAGMGLNPGGGGGIYCEVCSMDIINNTIVGNSGSSMTEGGGGGIYFSGSSLTITNTILWSNTWLNYVSGEVPSQIHAFGQFDISHSDVQGGIDSAGQGEGNISADPLFVDADNGDYHLSNISPCIGTGIMTQDVPATDIEGSPRPGPSDSNPDMGAYESPLGHIYVEIRLLKGWNLISLPLQPPNDEPSAVLSSINTRYNSVWTYDPDTGWSMFAPDGPSDLEKMERGKGYWIEMNQPGILAIQSTYSEPAHISVIGEEWNLIGYNSLITKQVKDFIWFPFCFWCICLYTYDSEGETWLGYTIAPGSLNTLEFVKPGKGYWAFAQIDWTIYP